MKKRNIIVAGFFILSFFIGSLISIPEEVSIAIIVIVSLIILHESKSFLFRMAGKKKERR